VHELPSSQAVPFGFAGFAGQVPPEQLACVWHWSATGQLMPLPPAHTPAWHASPVVHELPSLQAVPFGLFGFAGHTPPEHVACV
jgi:hypothetical protein